MKEHSPAWPHGSIIKVLPGIHFVTGTNKTYYEGVDLQHSRNMIIIRDGNKLSLINTVRLTDAGLAELEVLGEITNVIRIGAFHGRDDAFYIDRYGAKFWALKEMAGENGKVSDNILTPNCPMPFPNCSVIPFETSKFPEAMIHINQNNGVLITCDSIKNWVTADEFFSTETIEIYEKQGFFGQATINSVWLQACDVSKKDFDKLRELSFQCLLSAHGEPLRYNANDIVVKRIQETFG